MRWCSLLLLLVLQSDGHRGARAFQAKDYAAALQAFREAEDSQRRPASPELVFNQALAALGQGELRLSEALANKGAIRGGDDFVPLRDFLHGNAAWARGQDAARLVDRPEAGAPEMRSALTSAKEARRLWIRACIAREDWPEARRNLERCAGLIERLETRLRALEDQARKKKKQQKKKGEDAPREQVARKRRRASADQLSRERLERLLMELRQLEERKRRLRRQHRKAGSGGDW